MGIPKKDLEILAKVGGQKARSREPVESSITLKESRSDGYKHSDVIGARSREYA